MKTIIITTTINIPVFLESYIRNFKEYDIDPDRVTLLIVGDMKSPHEHIKKYIKNLNSDYPIEYWDVKSQRNWIAEHFPHREDEVNLAIPYNSIRRRNFAYLRTLELDAKFIISVDDDNYAGESNWLSEHVKTLDSNTLPAITSRSRVVNPCEILEFRCPYKIYPRGFPISKTFLDDISIKFERSNSVLNLGLWIKSPDVDAYTNLLYPELESFGLKEASYPTYTLAGENYMPINTQNTSFKRELVIPFYCLLMDTKINGLPINRYDDIWAGLFTLKLIHRIGDHATFGSPLTVHQRNKHDYISDFKSELLGMVLNDRVWSTVMNIDIHSRSYVDGYIELLDKFSMDIRKVVNNDEVLRYFDKMHKASRIWVSLCEEFS